MEEVHNMRCCYECDDELGREGACYFAGGVDTGKNDKQRNGLNGVVVIALTVNLENPCSYPSRNNVKF